MQSTETEKPKTRPRPTPRSIIVRDVQRLSPIMRRVTFGGNDLAGFNWSGPAAHMKIVFPEPGKPSVFSFDVDAPRPKTVRTYTPRRYDKIALTLDVDFVLHGDGPAATWAAQAQPGQQLVMMGPGRGYEIDPDSPWYVLAADDAALPAVETLLEAIPAGARVHVFLEVVAQTEKRPLAGQRNADVRWLPRGSGPAGSALLSALSDFTWPAEPGRVYVGCEADVMRRIRKVVVEASGLERERIVTRGYWKIGDVNHPDHDYVRD